jgi:UDP-3-O-[3-hydroxymyristoyl] glucosamine N-acyltransferase
MTRYTIKQIAEALGAEAAGDLALEITTINEPQSASVGELALAMEESYSQALQKGSAKAAILWEGADWQTLGLKAAIFAPRSRYVLSGVTRFFEQDIAIEKGIHPSAIIDPSARIGINAAIGPFVVIGADVEIGESARIMSHCSIAKEARIGKDVLLYQGVRIGARVQIGAGFICQPNAVIGADGFSFVSPKAGAIEEAKKSGTISNAHAITGFARINSLGSVMIGDNVELGANSTIDRGTISNTTIGSGTKLDNMVHLGHNVTVGEHCLLCGQSGVAGSTVIGDRVVIGGQSAISDHITVGSDVIIAGKSGVSSNVPPKRLMMGNPAVKMEANIESYKAIRRLPRLVAKVAALEALMKKAVLRNDDKK